MTDVRSAGCAGIRAALGEPMVATAPAVAASWLLVEHPGPWPATGLPADLPPEAVAVIRRATALGIRPQLVRRVRDRRRHGHLVQVASVRPGDRWLEAREVTDLRELADLDLTALAAGRRPFFGPATDRAVLLVCTHGRRDVCCARLGRPVAGVLAERFGDGVWETTHVGGDRFAANVVALPWGSYHGGLSAADAVPVAGAALRGEVALDHLRGCAGQPRATQAADWFLRQRLGLHHLDDVTPVRQQARPDGCTEVLLTAAGRSHTAVLRERAQACPRLTSCAGGGATSTPTLFELVRLDEPHLTRA